MKKFFVLAGVLVSMGAVAQVPVERGVSEALARYRKSVISNVHYSLEVEAPGDTLRRIVVQISFGLKRKDQPLQIDFLGTADQVESVEGFRATGAGPLNPDPRSAFSIPVRVESEHILIDTQFLRVGNNLIRVRCRPSPLAVNQRKDFFYSLLVPDRARLLFPCFDQPDLKASFSVKSELAGRRTMLTNGALQKMAGTGSKPLATYREPRPFSTYLFSIVQGDFSQRQRKLNRRNATFFFRETDTARLNASLDSIFLLHERALNFMEQYTGIRYPFTKLDFAAIPDFQYGGMEHVGAIDYKASSLFLDRSATKEQRQGRASLIAHEVAHMWFGDLVTMKWFNDVWMKEVFANFMADKLTLHPADRDAYLLKFMGHLPRAYTVDRTKGAHPIRQNLPNLNQAGILYGPIIYDKAPVMMQQLEMLMGEQAFRQGLREYLKAFAYGNADWNDLIQILDRRTPENLSKWNEAWVNGAGRPVIRFELDTARGEITGLRILQSGEQEGTPILPQQFHIALVYADRVEELPVKMRSASMELKQLSGRPVPRFIIWNTKGDGYGLFPADERTIFGLVSSPRMRAAAYINSYEQMLNGRLHAPDQLLHFMAALMLEKESLNQSMLAGYIGEIYWRYLGAEARTAFAQAWEEGLWQGMLAQQDAGSRKNFFRLFQNLATTSAGLDRLYTTWSSRTPPPGLTLNDDEYTSLALQLAVKAHPDTSILKAQLARLTNADRRARLQFLIPALSGETAVRDSFFASLRDPLVRKNESWVADALGYLHHPLRAASSIRYLEESLSLLEEIQRTGDIFFPSAWLNSTLGGHRSKEAADIVRRFLDTHPDYPLPLKRKVLQAADGLFRGAE